MPYPQDGHNLDYYMAGLYENWPLIIGPGWMYPPQPPAEDAPRSMAIYKEWVAAHQDLMSRARILGQSFYVTSLSEYRDHADVLTGRI